MSLELYRIYIIIINLHFVSISEEIPLETISANAKNMPSLPPQTWPWKAYDGNFSTTAECTTPCWISLTLPRVHNIPRIVVYSPTDSDLNDNDWKLYLSRINNTEVHIQLDDKNVKNCGKMVLSSGRSIEQQTYAMDCDVVGEKVVFYKSSSGSIAISEVKFFIKYAGKFDISTLNIRHTTDNPLPLRL